MSVVYHVVFVFPWFCSQTRVRVRPLRVMGLWWGRQHWQYFRLIRHTLLRLCKPRTTLRNETGQVSKDNPSQLAMLSPRPSGQYLMSSRVCRLIFVHHPAQCDPTRRCALVPVKRLRHVRNFSKSSSMRSVIKAAMPARVRNLGAEINNAGLEILVVEDFRIASHEPASRMAHSPSNPNPPVLRRMPCRRFRDSDLGEPPPRNRWRRSPSELIRNSIQDPASFLPYAVQSTRYLGSALVFRSCDASRVPRAEQEGIQVTPAQVWQSAPDRSSFSLPALDRGPAKLTVDRLSLESCLTRLHR